MGELEKVKAFVALVILDLLPDTLAPEA